MRKYVSKIGRPPSFAEFARFLIRKHPDPSKLDGHFRIQSAFCKLRENERDFVGKLTNLYEEMREFGTSLGFWEAYGASGFGENGTHAFGEKSYQARTHDSGSLIWEHYTEDLVMEVYGYYKEDFERFGFSVDEILVTKPSQSKPN